MDLGTVPAWGGSARLTRCVGRDHALDMILRAKKISGPEALRIGLVNEVWPLDELFDRADALAHELAHMPALAVAGVLRAVVGAGSAPLEEGIAAERRAVLETMGTADQREGMMAFLEKRKPSSIREADRHQASLSWAPVVDSMKHGIPAGWVSQRCRLFP